MRYLAGPDFGFKAKLAIAGGGGMDYLAGPDFGFKAKLALTN